MSAFGSLATSLLVVNGTVYLQDLASKVYAIDLQTGKLKWEKRYNASDVGPNGPAVDNGKVFVESNEQTVAALDANTGNQLWSKQIAPASTQDIDQQIAAYNGTLYVSTVPGPSVASFYVGGGMGIIYALNEQTGSQEWSFNTVQNGNLWGKTTRCRAFLPGSFGGVETPMALAGGVVYVPIVNAASERTQEGSSSDMTGWDMLEVFLALLVGGRCLLEGICYKKTARKSLHVLKAEYRYGMWRVRAFSILLGLLLMALGMLLAVIVSTHSPLLL